MYVIYGISKDGQKGAVAWIRFGETAPEAIAKLARSMRAFIDQRYSASNIDRRAFKLLTKYNWYLHRSDMPLWCKGLDPDQIINDPDARIVEAFEDAAT